jgi:hypothetical protein
LFKKSEVAGFGNTAYQFTFAPNNNKNIMRRLFVLTAIAVCSTLMAKAQKDGVTRFSLGPEIGIATGTFSNIAGLGLGATIQAEHFFQENVSGTAIFGFVDYFGASYNNNLKYKSTLILPLRVGGRYYIGDGFHLGAQIGLGFVNGYSTSTAFAYSPQVGYNFKTKKGKLIDATFKYDGYAVSGGTLSAVGIRVAYVL